MMRRYNLGLQGREFVIDVQELAADRFEVTVGGQTYEVTLSSDEDLPGAVITPAYQPGPRLAQAAGAEALAPSALPAAPARAAAAAAPASPRAASQPGAGGKTLNAPMPGVILELNVQPGDVVQRGQQIAVLDAMKMHNLIGAPRAGTITEVCVAAGQAVGYGEAIVRYTEG